MKASSTMTSPNLQYAKLDLIVGPMRSSKTTRLLQEAVTSAIAGFHVLFVNSSLDTRQPGKPFSTHNPSLQADLDKLITFRSVSSLKDLDMEDIDNVDLIVIEEAQFIPDLVDGVLSFVNIRGKRCIVGGLDGNAEQENFGQLHLLVPWADTVTKLNAICMRCSKLSPPRMTLAPFTFCKKRRTNEIEVGDDIYESLCRACLLSARDHQDDENAELKFSLEVATRRFFKLLKNSVTPAPRADLLELIDDAFEGDPLTVANRVMVQITRCYSYAKECMATFSIQEITLGSDQRIYTYSGTRRRVPTPSNMTIRFETKVVSSE